jgi:site-specific DNA-methyltransferase (adenine-specific)
MWVYGSGFPKSHDVSKAIDKAAGAEREVVGPSRANVRSDLKYGGNDPSHNHGRLGAVTHPPVTAPATDAARHWSGWGTALKPAWEPIIVARKPLVGTVAENVLRHGTGAINVDGCRVEGVMDGSWGGKQASSIGYGGTQPEGFATRQSPLGRWPANLIHDGSDEVVGLFPVTGPAKAGRRNPNGKKNTNAFGDYGALPDAVGGYDDSGGSAARFFYCAKASKADRDEGCEGLEAKTNDWQRPTSGLSQGKSPATGERSGVTMQPRTNHHPTVKPTALMRYLCRLVTPPGGVVLDPFTGSGSTGKGAVLEGFRFIGIEREAEYVEIAKARIGAVAKPAGGLFA